MKYVKDDVFTYMEKTFGRTALRDSGSGASGGASVTVNLTTGGGKNITPNKIVVYLITGKLLFRLFH